MVTAALRERLQAIEDGRELAYSSDADDFIATSAWNAAAASIPSLGWDPAGKPTAEGLQISAGGSEEALRPRLQPLTRPRSL
jgi:hypothetical protein